MLCDKNINSASNQSRFNCGGYNIIKMNENGFTLSWKEITVSINNSKRNFWKTETNSKVIIDRVSGEVKCGSLVAIMGPSGAGKTTLLAALAGKIKKDAGLLQINNQILTDVEIRSISGYLHQHFIVIESLTVKEHLIFMSALKLTTTNELKERIVRNVIFDLNLELCMDTPIHNISGGEKKRLALAVELLTDPLILYCDEPTTGLDSSSATAVIEMLHDKAVAGKVVIATIHQPSSQLYNCFDQIILIASGKLLFHGNRKQAQDFFDSMDLKCPKSYNPADFYIQNITAASKNSINTQQLELWSKSFEENRQNLCNGCVITEFKINLQVKHQKRNPLVQLYWLVWRCFIDTKRNMGHYIAHLSVLLFTALMLTILYSDIKISDENSVQNFKGILFFVTSELVYTQLYAVLYTFPEESGVFLREESLYSSFAYLISKIIIFIPRCIIEPFFFLSIIFVQIQFNSGFVLLLKMLVVLFVGCLSATTLGLCASAVFQSLESIELFVMPLDLLSVLMSGILVKLNTLPFYISWLKYSSIFFYVYESISILHWNDVTHLVCSNKTSHPCYNNGKEVLEDLGFDTNYSEILLNILHMFILSFGLCIVGYVGIIRKQKKSLG